MATLTEANKQAIDKKYGAGAANWLLSAGLNTQSTAMLKNGSWKTTPVSDRSKGTVANPTVPSANQTSYTYSSTNPSRLEEVKKNIEGYADQDSGKLNQNKAGYDETFHTKERDATQQGIMNEAYDNYNKYQLTGTENLYADKYAQVQKDKNAAAYGDAKKLYNQINDNFNKMADKVPDTTKKAKAQWDSLITAFLRQNAELRDLQNSAYKAKVREMNSNMAGENAAMASRLSAQGVSAGIINSSLGGIETKYNEQYGNLLSQHIDTLNKLTDSMQSFMTTALDRRNNLDQQEVNNLTNIYNQMKATVDTLAGIDKEAADSEYSAYEKLTGAKVDTAAEALQAAAKVKVKESEWANANTNTRKTLLSNYISILFNNDANLAKYLQMIDDSMLTGTFAEAESKLAAKGMPLKDNTKTVTKNVKTYVLPDGSETNNKKEYLTSLV